MKEIYRGGKPGILIINENPCVNKLFTDNPGTRLAFQRSTNILWIGN